MKFPRRQHGRHSQENTHDSSLFRALCGSVALHVAFFGVMVWISLTQWTAIGIGSVFSVSLVPADDAWTRETVPPPMDLLSAARWPPRARAASAAANAPRALVRPQRVPSAVRKGGTAQPDIVPAKPTDQSEMIAKASPGDPIPEGSPVNLTTPIETHQGTRQAAPIVENPPPPSDSNVSEPQTTQGTPPTQETERTQQTQSTPRTQETQQTQGTPPTPPSVAPEAPAPGRMSGAVTETTGEPKVQEAKSLPPSPAQAPTKAEVGPVVAPVVELPHTQSEGVPVSEPNPAASVQVAKVQVKEPQPTPTPQDRRDTSMPSASSEGPGQMESSPRPAMPQLIGEAAPAPLPEEANLSPTKPSPTPQAPSPQVTAQAPDSIQGPSKSGITAKGQRKRRAADVAGLPAATSAAQAREQRTAIAREQGTRWAEERRRELAEAQRRGLPAGTSAALAGLPAATSATQAGGTESHGTGGALGELTAVPVVPQISSRAETEIAAVAPPGQIGGSASSPQTLPPAPTTTVSPETSSQAGSVPVPKEGLPGVAIQIERPQPGTTHQGVQALVGRIVGGTTNEVVVHLNDSQQLLDVWGNTFEGEVNLRPGNNQLRVVAMGPRGPIAEKSIEIRYVPPPPAWGVRILRPANGTVLDSPGQDLIEVEGEVSEPGAEEARVTFNEFAIPVPVKDGRFSTIVPVLSPEVTIRAEVRGGSGTLSSDPIVIRRQPFKASKGYLMLYLPTPTRKVETRMWLSHRPNPSDVNTPRKVTSHFPSEAPGIGQESTIFAFPAVQEGVYTLATDYRVASGESVEKGWGLVFVPGPSGYRSLRLGPFQLTGKGRAILSKFILPYGVFWEEDFWFSGTAEGSDTLTKFRHPDGVSWTEKKGDPEFPGPK